MISIMILKSSKQTALLLGNNTLQILLYEVFIGFEENKYNQ